jgi:hypothetical protein
MRAFSRRLVFARKSASPLFSGGSGSFFGPTFPVVHQREMCIPARDVTECKSGSFTITGGDVADPIFRLIKDGFFTAITSAPFL